MSNQETDQLPGEPDAAYVRYLAYRNLGPGRSLEKAYNLTRGATDGQKRLPVPGQWIRDSSTYRWASRASQWDIHMLSEHGRAVISTFYESLVLLSRKALEAIDSEAFKPQTHAEVLSTITLIGSYISPEAIDAWTQSDAQASESENDNDEF